ncbi:protein-glutamate O-methyltransferase CheR [Microcoleus sp. FACHB-68]|uniref:CheR family methyltransferase n=1 Tax=Microcoleus sp. FACHB-68 TaxID=2692826 RepID=UPI001688D543|nr:protein-glutamate O-methyltransferase CheR [Microcoleus sp. FACHB-68]MBD1936622.1 tetratricopeptide repeat protein [Microcoleus sp. FACHB-68]
MNDALIEQFINLISATTGLYVRGQDRDALQKKILLRMKLLKLSIPDEYYQLLEAGTNPNNPIDAVQSEYEWKELTLLLTVCESYFFRDRGQFNLLKNYILPELIERQKPMRSLRIWSAGCSTGEEPYSLAILLQEMIPDWEQWDILILGTDINQVNIEKAKLGLYSSWSFRMVDPNLQQQHFSKHRAEWQVVERIRKMVTFQYGNLVKDPCPNINADIYSMDLIICRNVFVYFSAQAISLVLKKFYHALRPGAYLMTAHAELYAQSMGHFRAKVYPESVVYKRCENVSNEPAIGGLPQETHSQRLSDHESTTWLSENFNQFVVKELPAVERMPTTATFSTSPKGPINSIQSSHLPLKTAAPTSIIPKTTASQTRDSKAEISQEQMAQELLIEAETLFLKEAYFEAIKKTQQLITLQPAQFAAHYLMAQAYANLGQYEKASVACHRAIQLDSLSAEPYYLLAHIAEEQGDIEEAKMFCKRIIYLAPSSIFAYLELASLYEREGDMQRAKKMRTTAVELLKEIQPNAIIEHPSQLKASELLQYVQKMLKNYA